MKTVVYAGTRNLYDAMRVSVSSLLANNHVDRVYLLIEDDSFPYAMPGNVRAINVGNQFYFPPGSANYESRWTYMTLLRCALTKVLPHNKRVLWLDCDTIVDGDISELFSLDMEGMYVAGVREPDKCKGRTYINAGVLVLNLEQIRNDGLDDIMIDALNRERFSLPDQDAINKFAQGKIKIIPGRFNVCPFTEPTDTKSIYHFAGNGFFRRESKYIKYKERACVND